MEIYEILSNVILNIPAKQSDTDDLNGNSLANFCSQYLIKYCDAISKIENFELKGKLDYFGKPNNVFLIELVNTFKTSIRYAMISFLKGHPNDAYNDLTNSFEYENKKIFKELFNLKQYHFGDEKYFRLFYNIDNLPVNKDLLFHVPFELISKVANQRYSLAGFPCLYLGSSVYTCIKELNLLNKDLDLRNLLVSKFQVNTTRTEILNVEILDLTIKRSFLINKYKIKRNKDYEALFLYLSVFPLIFASSIKVKHPEDPFKPEYIIPQLLLQWVRKERIVEGIMYSSSKINNTDDNNFDKYYNLVIPPRDVCPKGQCSYLKKQFLQTEPCSFYEILGNKNVIKTSVDIKMSQQIENYLTKTSTFTVS